MSCSDQNAFHPRKGKPIVRWGRKETAAGYFHHSPEGCSTEGLESGEPTVHPATTGTRKVYGVVPI
jgi:hypothetical protein